MPDPDDDPSVPLGPLGPDARALLESGVAAGVISPAQRDALIALAPPSPRRPAPPVVTDDARGGLDGVVIAYGVGAALVVFALGWFLADRWRTLGPAGVLAVAVGYAALFSFTAHRFARVGHPERSEGPLAAGVAWALASLTAPIAAWSLLRLVGEWPADLATDPLARDEVYMATRRLVVELSTVLAGLVLLRALPAGGRVRRTPIGIPLAAATGAALTEITSLVAIAVAGFDLLMHLRGWAYATAGATLFGIAYVADRHPERSEGPRSSHEPREDFAAWLYAAACIVFEVGLLDSFNMAGRARHALALVALVQFAAATRLRRRALLVAGVANAIWYLGYLAFDVFKGVLSFPFLLAAFGVAVLVVTVVVQRRFPGLVRRAADDAVPPPLPGGALTAWAPAVVAAALLGVAVPRARWRAEQVLRGQRAAREQMHAERQRAGRPIGPPRRPPSNSR